jgi:uncharacterized protein
MSDQTRRPATRLDPRSPLVLDTRELGRRPGSMRTVSRTVPAPPDLGGDILGVPEGSPLELDLRLESVVEGVLVSASVLATVAGECVRCLEPLRREIEVEFQELYAYAGAPEHHRAVADEDDEDAGELRMLDGDLLDLEPEVRDAVVLALPFQPLCRPDCPGLCSECGIRLETDQGQSHGHESSDPRWAALRGLPTETPDS